eukprot:m.24667 g.24667  ORF g.24667 m.24667 type:complete len:244 (+) comp11303_c0_seq1:104-835(+)
MPLSNKVKGHGLIDEMPRPRQLEKAANREGMRKTLHEANGDKYTGEWHLDKRHGKGTCVYKNGGVYDGDWASGVRHGYGVKSMITSGAPRKEYAGNWVNDRKDGYGTLYYKNGEVYDGEWFDGKRSGWGRMSYEDGSVYEGGWLSGKRSGLGLLVLSNENRYEGEWEDGDKHGDGKFFYLDKGQLYIGTWVRGTAKCGEMIDLQRQYAEDPTMYPIPKIELKDAAEILAAARAEHLEAAAQVE